MPAQSSPEMDYAQLLEDQSRALEQSPRAEEQLPAYSEATQSRSHFNVTEKQPSENEKQKSSSKMATLKSILLGDVHKHNPRYGLEESVSGDRSVRRQKDTSSAKPNQIPYMSPQMQWNHDRILALQGGRRSKSSTKSSPAPSKSSSEPTLSPQMQWNHDRVLAFYGSRKSKS